MAERQGLRLVKSRRRDPRALDYGVFWLRKGDDPERVVFGGTKGADLDAIEKRLTR
jgi:hypothetical protein